MCRAEKRLQQTLEEHITCCVCKRTKLKPKFVAPCCHSVCAECVAAVWGGNPRACPVCKTPIKADTDAAKLHDDHPTAGLVLAQRRVAELTHACCSECDPDVEPEEVTGYCQDCGVVLCAAHLSVHRLSKGKKDHHIMPMEDMAASRAQLTRSTRPCETHGEPCDHLCTTCSCAVCFDCVTTTHRAHDITTAKDALEARLPPWPKFSFA